MNLLLVSFLARSPYTNYLRHSSHHQSYLKFKIIIIKSANKQGLIQSHSADESFPVMLNSLNRLNLTTAPNAQFHSSFWQLGQIYYLDS